MPTPTTRFANLANLKSLFAGLKQKYAAITHSHAATDITSGTLPVSRGGTNATTAADARTSLGITPANIGAVSTSDYRAGMTWGELEGSMTWGDLEGDLTEVGTTTTTNLSLEKPGLNDEAGISQINDNMDVLDAKIGAVGNTSLQSQVNTLRDSVGSHLVYSPTTTAMQVTDGVYTYRLQVDGVDGSIKLYYRSSPTSSWQVVKTLWFGERFT